MSGITLEWSVLNSQERIQLICRNGIPIFLANEYLVQKFHDSLSPSTAYTYASRLVIFFKWLEKVGLSLEELSVQDLYQFRDALELVYGEDDYLFQQREVAESTKYQTLACALRYLDWLRESRDQQPILRSKDNRAKHSFLRGITVSQLTKAQKSLLKRNKKRLPKFLTEQEMQKVREWIDQTWENKPDLRVRNRAIFELLFDTGVRIGELCGLKILDMNDDEGLIRVSVDHEAFQLKKRTGKKRIPLQKTGARTVLVSDETVRLLSEYINLYRPRESIKYGHGHIFCTHYPRQRRGKPMTANALEHIFERMNRPVSQGGLPVSKRVHAHLWRHTSATFLTEKGVSTNAVQENLGHQDSSTTEQYTHVAPSARRKEFDKVWPRNKDLNDWGIED